jgi:predicted PurR-regulated permease PerM
MQPADWHKPGRRLNLLCIEAVAAIGPRWRMGTEQNHHRNIDYTLRSAIIAALLLLAAAALGDVLLLVFAAILVASVLRGGATWLHRRTGLGTGWCLAIVVVLIVLLFTALFWLEGSRMIDEAATVADTVRQEIQHLWDRWQNNPSVQRLIPRLKDQAGAILGHLTSLAPGVASSVIGVGGDLVVIFATGVFLAMSPETYVGGFLRLLPPRWRARGHEVMEELGRTLQLWFLGQFLDMLVVAVLTGAGLFFLGVPLALTLATIAGLFNFVPYIGALAGAVPALAVAVAQSPQSTIYVAILYAVVQTLEGNVIAPLIQKRTVHLPPALTILSQTVLGTLFGVMGLILATPLFATAMTAVRMVYVESVLEKPDRPPGADR